jgi:myxalamid-type polyketide synthase MxaE and MxaD
VDATYVLTGAFGGIGLAVARWMVQQGARRLILIGRTPLPPRDRWAACDPTTREGQRVAAVRELEALGAAVHLAPIDLGDEPAVDAFFDAFEREGWPEVRGVVHCAAVADDRLLANVDQASLVSVMQPKAIGVWVLDRRLRRAPLDFFISFSSLGSLLGQAGQASYAAANAFLDAFAACQRADGRRAISINWGGWRGLGFAGTAGGQHTISRLEASGIRSFDVEDGLQALGMALGADCSQLAVVPADWARFRASVSGARERRLVDDLVQPDQAESAASPKGPSFRATLAEADASARTELLELHLQEQLAQVLRLPISRLDPVKPLGSLGLESLMALELRNRLERTLGVKLSATLVWNHPTIRALAAYLLGRLAFPAETRETPQTAEVQQPAAAAIADIGGLSEDEALRALLQGKS